MKKIWLLVALAAVLLIIAAMDIGNYYASRDKDVSVCEQKFKSEVCRDVAKRKAIAKSFVDSQEGLNAAYAGELDKIILERNKLLHKKGIIILRGGWYATKNIEVCIDIFYVPLKPWKLASK